MRRLTCLDSGCDSVQLAAALELAARCLTAGAALPPVITADAGLSRAAVEGLAVDAPNAHPRCYPMPPIAPQK